MDGADILLRHPVPRHRITVADYHRLTEAGVLGADDRVELLDGQLVDMSPIGPRHAVVVDALMYSLIGTVAERALVRVQQPVVLDTRNEPQPDITVVRRPWRGYPETHPGPGDVFLLVEVADTSLATDRGAKRELYARAGIAEYWLADLTTDRVHVHRKPANGSYGVTATIGRRGVLKIEALPGAAVDAAAIFA